MGFPEADYVVEELKPILNTDSQIPINHLIWLNDYKVYGEESYVYQNKNKLHELYKDFALCIHDKSILEETTNWCISNSCVGAFLAEAYDIDASAVTVLRPLTTMNAIVASSAAMNAIVASPTAMNAVMASSAAMNAIVASSAAMNVIARSSTAMNAIVASPTAMNAVMASSAAMSAIVASSAAMNIIFANSTARNAFIASSTAMNAFTTKGTSKSIEKKGTVSNTMILPYSDNTFYLIKQIYVYDSIPRDGGGSGTAYLKTNYDQSYDAQNIVGSGKGDLGTTTWTINKICKSAEYYTSEIVGAYPNECTQRIDYIEVVV